ncbi:hypothetical protein Back11_32210 [Paenibacillus baekrokdamisoli]|uniref:Uncharacterized protein n=1 Tax=Paenibacillus baekrokdamisoli TaxID=1712516 RepID=A0A3G9IU18_9BACL|nr:transglutaminase domain-containing protein [Paenibacillus baekrokdamisoli]MBB3071614.1 transglutaminase/protease-like cytokinesis protein 3 [Paenibacillus baekrokdamisoli]BBH21876.1 hypothetical protein Back11_32210 [Paenibacillus baekrokdamisoli]
MKQLMFRFSLVALLLLFGLGSDFYYTPSPTVTSASTMKELESKLDQKIREQSNEITMEYTGDQKELSADFAKLLRNVFAKDDYTAYILDSYLYTIRTWGSTAKIKISIKYRETAGQTEQVAAQIKKLLPTIIKPYMTDLQKIKMIHDWIVLHVAYDLSLERYTAYDAIHTGKTVCQGYSLLAYRMLNEAGIEVRIIEGTVDSGNHVWNLVHIGDTWYHMDVTWDDPIPDREGKVSYSYFLKNDAQMKKDHQWVKWYPAAN